MSRKAEDVPFLANGIESLWRSPSGKDKFSEMGIWNAEKVSNNFGRDWTGQDWLPAAAGQSLPSSFWKRGKEPVQFEPFNDYPSIWSRPELPATGMRSTWLSSPTRPVLPTANDFMFYGLFQSLHRVGEELIFFLEPLGGISPVDGQDFRVRVMRKDGSYIQLRVRSDPKCKGRFVCTFKPQEAGEYILTAKYCAFANAVDVHGSPQSLHVAKRFDEPSASISRVPIGTKPFVPATKSVGKLDMKPWGLAVHPGENLIYATDRLSHCIMVMKPGGCLLRKFGTFGTAPGELFRPCGIALDLTRERVIVTDKDNHRVAVYGLSGEFIATFGSRGFTNGQLHYPWGVTVSPDGSMICVADSRNHRIQIFDGETFEFIRKYSAFESNPFEYKTLFDSPRDVLFDSTGQFIYVTDFNIHALFKIDVNCKTKELIAGPKLLQRPQGLAWDVNGNLLLADSSNHCIRVFNSSGKYLHPLNGGHIPLESPLNVATLPGGKHIVVDSANFIRTI